MVKISGKIIVMMIVIMIFQTIFMPITNVEAADEPPTTGGLTWEEMIGSADGFLAEGKSSHTSNVDDSQLTMTIQQMYNVLLALGVVVAVFVGAGLGIKYIVGSIEEQAKIKETLLPYVVGCVVVFGAFGIWRILINVLSKV